MYDLLLRHWWVYVLRGILAIAFGFLAILWPELTLGILIFLFGIYVLVEGALAMAAAVSNRHVQGWWVLLLEGVAGLGAGFFAFLWPGITAIILLIIIALWAIVTGVLEIMAAVQLRRILPGEWALGLIGVLSVLIGVILIASPSSGALAVVWVIGIYALLFGGLLTHLGFKVKSLRERGSL